MWFEKTIKDQLVNSNILTPENLAKDPRYAIKDF